MEKILDTMNFATSIHGQLLNKVAAIGTMEPFGPRYLGYLDLENQEFVDVIAWPFTSNISIWDMKWLDESNIILTHGLGIHQLNINTGSYTPIKEVCENLFYKTLAILPDQNAILVGAIDRWNNGTDNVHEEWKIIHLDLDTGEERFINLE